MKEKRTRNRRLAAPTRFPHLKVLMGLGLLAVALSGMAWARPPAERAISQDNFLSILSDGQFVYGPNVADFDLVAYLDENSPTLSLEAQDLKDKASYYSINPRVLLTILEIRSDAVTADPPLSREEMDHIVGYEDIVGYDDQLFRLCETLKESYYHRLYSEPLDKEATVALTLGDGTTVHTSAATNAGTLAILKTLAPFSSLEQWQALTSEADSAGFLQTYRRLFPGDDPLDGSNQVIPREAPPATLLKFPYACNDTWIFSGGPHDGDCNPPFVAVDFAPGVGYCVIPPDRWIVSPADGTVSEVACGGCQIKISHEAGWGSFFYHVANPQVSAPQTVYQDQAIGNPSTKPTCGGSCGGCGGSATGTHVHYALMYNGAFVAIEGTAFEGWVVHGTTCYNGYLEKDGVQIWKGSPVTSTDCPGDCCCSSRSSSYEGIQSVPVVTPRFPDDFDWSKAGELEVSPEPTSVFTTTASRELVEIEDLTGLTSLPVRRETIEVQRIPPTSANYRIAKSVFGSGGGEKASAHYVMNTTQGQSTDLRRRHSASYVLVPGYWSRWIPPTYEYGIYLPLLVKGQ